MGTDISYEPGRESTGRNLSDVGLSDMGLVGSIEVDEVQNMLPNCIWIGFEVVVKKYEV